MPEKINFTKTIISNLPLPEGEKPAVSYDKQVSGLIVMVFPSGTKVFYLSKKINGKSEKIKLGKFPDLSVENARDKASLYLAEIIKGHNPQEAKRAFNNEMTFKDLFEWYTNEYSRKHKSINTLKDEDSKYRLFLADWHNKKISMISKLDVSKKHQQIGENRGKVTANRTLSLIKSMFNKAIELGKWTGSNPAIGILPYKEVSRERFLHQEEVKRFIAALNNEPNETARDFILLSLLTGARKTNVLEMQWNQLELDGDSPTWRIPVTKNGEGLTLPLAPEAIKILKKIKKANKSQFVFPGTGKAGRLRDPRKAFLRILKEAEIEDFHLHDLRRTLGSWLAASGANQYVIGKTLGHKSPAATAIYARVSLDPVRESVNAAAKAMLKTIS